MERPPSRGRFAAALINALGPFLGLILVVGLFSLSSEVRASFLTGINFKIILLQTVIVGIGTLGMTMIIVSGGIDLSVGSVVALCSVIGAVRLNAHTNVFLTSTLVIAAGAGIGLLNGSLVAALRIMPFIVTLGMMGIVRGVAKWLSGSQTVSIDPETPLNRIMDLRDPTRFWPLPVGVWVAIALSVVMHLVMKRTILGRYVFAIGANEQAARLSGVRVQLQKVYIYTLAGVLFGVAGLMQLSRLTQGDPTVAIGLELDIIAAAVIGGASLNGGSGSIPGSMIGALMMACLRNGSNQMNWPTYVQEIIIGAVIIIAVGLDHFRHRNVSRA